jgi:putative hemolysin
MKNKFTVIVAIFLLGALALSGCNTAPEEEDVGMANPASVYCEEQGYTLDIRIETEGGGQYNVCVFPDGSVCEEWAFYRGECGPGISETEPEPTEEPNAPVDEIPEGAIAARDTALAFIREQYGDQAPPADLTWFAEDVTQEGLVGASTVQFSAGDWVITIEFPIVAPDAVVYHVAAVNEGTDFRWEGEIDSLNQVTETVIPGGAVIVVGWLGYIASTPDGAEFDDYVVFDPEGAGSVGIAGETPEIEAKIITMRDAEEPGKYAHFWGRLTCDVPDYNDCQLLATRVRRGATTTGAEPVVGIEGTIVANEPGAQFDDYLVLSGNFPVGYGIDSLDTNLQAQLESLRDTGTVVRVSGELSTGVLDAFGSQIQIYELEIVDQP